MTGNDHLFQTVISGYGFTETVAK